MNTIEVEQTTQKKSAFSFRDFFKVDPTIGVSKFRVYILRAVFFMIALFLGKDVWTEIFTHKAQWEPLPAIAFSFWAAFSALAILGILYPVKMIPLLLIQLTYKTIWLVIVAYPLWSANQLTGSSAQELTKVNLIAAVLDLFVIPWPFVFRTYILGRSPNQ